MNVSGSKRYTINDLRTKINDALLDEDMSDKLYQSMNGTSRMIDAIIKTRGDGWAAHVVDSEGKEMLTSDEQELFTRAFQPYLDSIIEFFDDNNRYKGGELATDEKEEAKDETMGPDEIYSQIINKFGEINSTVNGFASKYGVLRLEKEHDIEPDMRLIPKTIQNLIKAGVTAANPVAGTALEESGALDRVKVPFRLIVSLIYLFLDVARIVVSVGGSNFGRKILSITLSLLEFLRGDWKKAILSFIGYYGMTPLLVGQTLKAILTLFRMTSPEIQQTMIYGVYDTSKSLLIGILLAIFRVTAPEEVRLPLINILKTIASKKEELDTSLEEAGLTPQPDYLVLSFEDLNNLQAVIANKTFYCSEEFTTLSETVNKSAILRIILQLVGIPIDNETKDRKCGDMLGKPYVDILAETYKKDTSGAEEELKETPTPISLNKNPATLPNKNPITGGRRIIRRKITPSA
jgi:hypothetical protein